jgi:hypothetical protein
VGPSVGAPLTNNDSELINLNLISGIPSTGLIAAAGVDNSGGVFDHLSPLSNPIHARVYWINAVDGVLSRVLEPISIRNPELYSLLGGAEQPAQPAQQLGADWNPLRTGATFVAPLEGSGVRTTLYFVCPTQNIIPGVFPENTAPPFSTTTAAVISSLSATIPTAANGTVPFAPAGTAFLCTTNAPIDCRDAFTYTGTTSASFTGVSGIGGVYPSGRAISPIPVGGNFPHLGPAPVTGTGATPLFLRVYDDEEHFRRNVDIFCRCWGAHPLVAIDPIYSNPDPVLGAPHGTYTEVEGEPACTEGGTSRACSFTGYRAIQWGQGVVGNDVFGRLSNGSWKSLQGVKLGAGAGIDCDTGLNGGTTCEIR